jgi:membrane protease YdiL (CAAX protease family)
MVNSLSVKHRLYLAFETMVLAGGLMALAFLMQTWSWVPRMPVFGASWLLVVYMLGIVGWLRLRGEPLADYGLFEPASWPRAVGVAIAMLVAMYVYMNLINPHVLAALKPWIGSGVNLTRFDGLKGNVWLYLEILPMVWLSAGFTEEFLFRGFLFNRLLMIFGRGPTPFVGAAIIQAVLFSLGHIYQGWPGVISVAAISFFLLAASRVLKGNLWPAVIMHGLVDSISLAILVFRDHFKP